MKLNLIEVNKQKIKQCFNKAAKTYDDNCYVQKLIGAQLIAGLKRYIFKDNNY